MELGFRMQGTVPEVMDIAKESPATLEMYGVNKDPMKQYGTNCLLARRLVERGVRFVMMMHASWDDHTELNRKLLPEPQRASGHLPLPHTVKRNESQRVTVMSRTAPVPLNGSVA